MFNAFYITQFIIFLLKVYLIKITKVDGLLGGVTVSYVTIC